MSLRGGKRGMGEVLKSAGWVFGAVAFSLVLQSLSPSEEAYAGDQDSYVSQGDEVAGAGVTGYTDTQFVE